MNPLCETCKHWHKEEWAAPDEGDVVDALWDELGSLDVDYTELRETQRPTEVVTENAGRWGRCHAVSHGWGLSARAYTMDASMYRSSLRCRNDFGCVEWAPVEEQQ